MTTALIVIGVVLFLAVDAIVLWRFLGPGNRAGRYGSMTVPGEATLSLPAGRIRLTYREAVYTSGGGEGEPIPFYPPADLEVRVAGADGGALVLERGTRTSTQSIAGFMPGGPSSSTRLGFVNVPAAGQYRISVSASTEGRVEPLVLVGG